MKDFLKTERVPIMFDPALLRRIDDYSFQNRIRTRAETIRQLVTKGMGEDAKEKGEATA
jgi:metal-responsive CopG/Arc/MetJ family transcriptional regulator